MKILALKTTALFIALCGASALLAAPFVHKEYAAETTATRLGSTPLQGGTLYVKRCDHCALTTVSVNADTLYYRHGELISTASAVALDGQGATIFFDPETKYVTRIVFWRTQ